MHVARADQIELVTVEFVLAVGAQAQRPSQKELRDPCAHRTKRRASFGLEKHRGGVRDWLEVSQLQVHRREALRDARAVIRPVEIRFQTDAAAGNDRIIRRIQEVV